MQLGLFTMPLHPPGADFTATLKADLDQIVKLDELGYSEVWIGEHFTSEWENIPAPDLLIAQAIPLTKQIRLGTGVSCIPNHDPFVLAHRIAQLDHMAEGRFNWGVGTGSFPGDMQVFGYWGENPAINNQSYTRAALDTILKLWTDPEPGVYESDGFRFHRPRDRYRLRAARARSSLSEAASAHRRRRGLAALVHAQDGRGQGLDAHVDQPHSPGAAQDPLGCDRRRR